MSNKYICPTHFTEDDYSYYYSQDAMEEAATFKLTDGHIHVQQWNLSLFICTRQLCINRQREHDKYCKHTNNIQYFICYKNDCEIKHLY